MTRSDTAASSSIRVGCAGVRARWPTPAISAARPGDLPLPLFGRGGVQPALLCSRRAVRGSGLAPRSAGCQRWRSARSGRSVVRPIAHRSRALAAASGRCRLLSVIPALFAVVGVWPVSIVIAVLVLGQNAARSVIWRPCYGCAVGSGASAPADSLYHAGAAASMGRVIREWRVLCRAIRLFR